MCTGSGQDRDGDSSVDFESGAGGERNEDVQLGMNEIKEGFR